MKKNILMIGNKHLLSAVLGSLSETPFLLENDIDIIISHSIGEKRKSLLKEAKKISKYNLSYNINKLFEKILLYINHKFYKEELSKIITTLFPSRDISNLKDLSNIRFLKFDGLNIKNLESYDFMIVASFSKKIPKEIFGKPRMGTLNIHPSFLPELRGGYPLYVATYFKMSDCATSIHFMDEKWDHGDIVDQKRIKIDSDATYQERMDCSAKSASDLLNNLHDKEFKIIPKTQSHGKASYCNKILEIKHNISMFTKSDSFEGYIAANYHETLYPFSFTYYRGFIFSILKVKRIQDMHVKKKGLFYINNKFFYAFYGEIFLIVSYIYKGKLTVI
jgi:methionyl-tRNA formyltransferase